MRGGRDATVLTSNLKDTVTQPLKFSKTVVTEQNSKTLDDIWTMCVKNDYQNLEQYLDWNIANATHELGSSLLMTAVFKGHIKVAKVLLNKGANVNHTNDLGQCALTMAVRNGDLSLMKFVVDLPNIDLAIKDNYEKFPIQYLDPSLKQFACRDILADAILKKLEQKTLDEEKKERYIEAIKAYLRAAGDAYFTKKVVSSPYTRLLALTNIAQSLPSSSQNAVY